jgi:hypothetical protein
VNEALYFSTYDMLNFKWTSPAVLDHRIDIPSYWGPAYPAMLAAGDDVVILYNGGNPDDGQYVDQGRPVMKASISRDGGLSWDGPSAPFPLHNGRSGEHALAVDSNGKVHGLFVMRIDQQFNGEYSPVGGIWHSAFQNGIWGNPDRIVTTVPAHDVRAIVVQGNVLLVVWIMDPGDGMSGVWYSYFILDAPELPVATAPAVLPAISTGQFPTQAPVIRAPTSQTEILQNLSTPRLGYNPSFPVLVGIASVFLLVIGLLVARRFFNDKRG